MYQQYFGLTEAPFSIAPDPRYLFLSDKHREALGHLIYGVGDQGGFVLLTGEVGTGKTTICRCLLQQVPDNADIAFIINPKQSINQLLQSIFNDLSIEYDKGMTSKDLIDQLNYYLLDAHARGRNTILIIDEAQNLSVDVLEQLRLLTNLETNEKKLLQLVLLGQPELNNLLSKPELRQLAQRVTARYHLAPLSKPEVIEYIEHRLSVAGCRSELFPAAAINKIYQLSKGVPRLINLICDRALLGVYATNSDQASAKIVSKAAKEIFPARGRFNWKPVFLSLLLALMILSVSVWWKNNYSETVVEQNVSSTKAVLAPVLPFAPSAKSFSAAVSALYSLWGAEKESDELWCDVAMISLYCHSAAEPMATLLSYNVPFALQLRSNTGETYNVLLTAVEGGTVTVVDGQQRYNVAIESLAQLNIVNSVVLLRIPKDISLPARPGDSGKTVAWLQQLLNIAATDGSQARVAAPENSQAINKAALLYAHYLSFDQSSQVGVYDEELRLAIYAKQKKLGLDESAVVDLSLAKALVAQRYQQDPVLNRSEAQEG